MPPLVRTQLIAMQGQDALNHQAQGHRLKTYLCPCGLDEVCNAFLAGCTEDRRPILEAQEHQIICADVLADLLQL